MANHLADFLRLDRKLRDMIDSGEDEVGEAADDLRDAMEEHWRRMSNRERTAAELIADRRAEEKFHERPAQ